MRRGTLRCPVSPSIVGVCNIAVKSVIYRREKMAFWGGAVEVMNQNSAFMLDTRQARGDIRVPSLRLLLCRDD